MNRLQTNLDKSTHTGVKQHISNMDTGSIPTQTELHVPRGAPAGHRLTGDSAAAPRLPSSPRVRRHHRDGAPRPRRPRPRRPLRRVHGGAVPARRCTSSSPASVSARPPAPSTRTPSPRRRSIPSRSGASVLSTPARPPAGSRRCSPRTARWSSSPTRCRSPPGWPACRGDPAPPRRPGPRPHPGRGRRRRSGSSPPCASTSLSSAPTASASTTGCPRPTATRPPSSGRWSPAPYVVVVADSSKVGREDFVSFAPITRVDMLVTDAEISDADRATLTEQRRRGGRIA